MKAYFQLFITFFKIGLFTVGGGLAMLPLIQRAVVEDRKWMTEEEMVDCLTVCQSLPGVMSINAATYVGKTQKGIPGALVASLGTVLPSFVLILLAILFLQTIGDNAHIQGAFSALKAASCAMILYAAYIMGRKVMRSVFAWVLAITSFVMIVFLGLAVPWVILLGVLSGLILMAVAAQKSRLAKKREEAGK